MSNTFSPRTDGTVGKVAVRSQAHAAHLTIPLMLDAGSDIQDNNPTGPEHTAVSYTHLTLPTILLV